MTLVHVDLTGCPDCTAPLAPATVAEPALFRHGGYGATRSTETLTCGGCGWSLVVVVEETRPDRRAAGE